MSMDRGTKDKAHSRDGETIVLPEKTVLLENESSPVIFGWLVHSQREEIRRISKDVFHIGSGSGVQLRISKQDVKEVHCSIYFVTDHFEINDNNTVSGTWVNQKLVKRQDLADNDQLTVGGENYIFKCFYGNSNG